MLPGGVLGIFFFFQAEDGIRDSSVTGVQTCALPIFCARGPSGTFTASTPAFFNARHCSSIGAGSMPLGGTISTLVTSSPRASLLPQRDFSARATGVTPAGACTDARDTTTLGWRGTTLAT